MSQAIRTILETSVAEGYAPGMVALVAHGDHAEVSVVGSQAFAGAPIGRDAIFRIASMTKPITAAATLILVEEGKLSLDEPVDRLLPELKDRRVLRRPNAALDDTVPAKRAITVENLLTYRMGLGLLFGSPDAFPILAAIAERDLAGFGPPRPDHDYGPDEWMRRLGELPLMAQPGETWLYSAPSNVLGILLARAAGQPFPDVLRERLFEPLGMTDTAFFVPPAKHGRLTAAYWPTASGPVPNTTDYGRPPAFPAGDAGLLSTADDIFAFSRFLLCGRVSSDGARLIRESHVVAMTHNQLTPAQRAAAAPILPDGCGWGYGVAVALRDSPDGVPAGAFGWNGGLGTSWVMDPARDRTAILLTGTAFTSPDPPPIHKAFWRLAFG